MSPRRNVLIFHQAALGDFLVTWPIAVALGRIFPQSRVSYVTHSSKGALAGRVIGVEAMDVERDWHRLHGESPELPESNAKALAAAHTIVSFVSNPDDIWEQNLARLAPQATLVRLKTKPLDDAPILDPELPESLQNHVSAAQVAQLAPWPMIQTGVRQILRSIVDRGLPVRRSPDSGVVIHPGAGKPEKCWPVDRFVELATRLKQTGIAARVLLGEIETEKWPADAISRIGGIAEIRKPATYLDLLNEIASAAVFVGNDSGPGHLAGIIGVPTISLFGTSPDRWKPIGPAIKVLRGNGMETISVDQVQSAIMSLGSFRTSVG